MKTTLKRILALLLVLCSLLLVSCGGKYSEVRSSRKDRQVVAKIGKYDVKYEIVRALFHTMKPNVDGGDESVWDSAEAPVYFERTMEKVEKYLLDIFGAFALAESVGIDPYGKEIDEMIDSYVTVDIDGGTFNGTTIQGYGSKKAYLEALAKFHYTDSANRFMYRYTATIAKMHEYFVQTFAGGTIDVSDTVLREFLLGPDVIHVHWVYREKTDEYTDEQWDEYMQNEVRAQLLPFEGREEILDEVRSLALYLTSINMEHGFYLTENTVGLQYEKIVETAKWLSPYEVSDVIDVSGGSYILVGMERDTAVLSTTTGVGQIGQLYLEYCMYNKIAEQKNTMSVTYKPAFDQYVNTVLE